ncbi:DUF4226 domain-containing protein [Mycobacterium sp. M1]|uniref:DUF4226 domain-containing protein n=1 Tax=Mycolicibacter acidiphilus TaxID=2835306 RepID=A0ABS5RJF4_9MYCO|nr:DUF4226 domain-containing protein [Mycolicibacter acidiphilus]MBS9533739.1 DUF4226 domain-containing protein [Mycolicibacter acidiphilus]
MNPRVRESQPEPTVLGCDQSAGCTAQAIRDTEAHLAQRLCASAELDRQLVDTLLLAQLTTVRGRARLDHLEADIVAAARTWDLSTPVGEREFQRFLTARLGDVIDVVEDADGDAAAKRTLVAALTALYRAPADPGERAEPAPPPGEPDPDGDLADAYLDEPPEDPLPPGPAPAPWRGTPAMPELSGMPGFGGELPGLGGLPAAGMSGLPLGLLSGLHRGDTPAEDGPAPEDPPADPPAGDGAGAAAAPDAAGPVEVRLPDGTTTSVADPKLAAAMQAVADGTPVAEAFAHQGIDIPPPGTTVSAPVDPTRLRPGDLGVFTDRHALAVGDGRALLDGQFQDVANLRGPGFLGWLHPRGSAFGTAPDQVEPPEPTRPATGTARSGR